MELAAEGKQGTEGGLVNHRFGRLVVVVVAVAALFLPGCAPPIPIEKVPEGWALNTHQPGEWWTQPVIPRSVVVQRCPPPAGWASEPDLTRVTGLRPGIDVNYSFWTDDYHCYIGWSQLPSRMEVAPEERATEPRLRRICATSGLDLDQGWRFLGHSAAGRSGATIGEVSAVAFIDEHHTVVGCILGYNLVDYGISATVELSVGADGVAGGACPVRPSNLSARDDQSVETYELKGAGVVRDRGGRVLAEAASLRIGLAGDSVTTTHPVVDGVAIVGASVTPKAAIRFQDWDHPPAVEGQILDADGKLLATCRA